MTNNSVNQCAAGCIKMHNNLNASIRLRKFLHKPLLSMMKSTRNFDLKLLDEENLKKSIDSAIYVVNHTNSHDIPVASEVIAKHHYVLLGKQPLKSIDRIAFCLNGVIWVDRKSKASKAEAKRIMVEHLKHRTNVLMFPEGTWNRSPNKIMQPLYWGVIDIAKECNAPVVPIILEYTKEICYAKIGLPIYIESSSDKKQAIDYLQNTMAAMRYELWEMLPRLHRKEIETDYFDKILQHDVEEYPKLNLEYETSVVRKEYEESKNTFAHLGNIKPSLQSAFLFNKRLI